MRNRFAWTSVALAAALASSVARGQMTDRVSVATGGAQGSASSSDASISADDRFVVFVSGAASFVPADTNGVPDVFVRDRQLGTTERVSVSTSGAEANFICIDPAISGDGRFVVFVSEASTLVAGDTNAQADVFVHDRLIGTTERVSVVTGGAEANAYSQSPAISADGRFVAFTSFASNLVAGDTNGGNDIFVHDLQTGSTERVSVGPGGAEASPGSFGPAISADGRFVAFSSGASNLVAGDTNSNADVFVRDRQSGTTERVSVMTSGAQASLNSQSASLSADGRFVAFDCQSGLVPGDVNPYLDVYVRDRLTATTERMSVPAGTVQSNGSSRLPSISADGRCVAFHSSASNIVLGDANGRMDVFLRDRQTGTTELLSVSTTWEHGDFDSLFCSISDDGLLVAFSSQATNLVALDTNATFDCFMRERGGVPPPASFCFGDGTGTTCPCGTGAAGNGCPSSVNPSGANLSAGGTSSLASDTLVITGSGMPNGAALYFQGDTPVNGGAGSPFGDGLLCISGTVIRLGTHTNAGGTSQYPQVGDPSLSVRGVVTAPGTRAYQVWYRNAAAFCTPSTFNLTNAVAVTWTL